MSRVVSSINSPSLELFRTCRPHGNIRRTWLVPLRRTFMRPALRPRRASWSVSYELRGARATGVPQKGEESINIRLRETLAFHFLLVTRFTSPTAPKRPREIAFIFSRREKIERRTCGVAKKNTAICRAVR